MLDEIINILSKVVDVPIVEGFVREPTYFPHISIEEIENTTYIPTQDSGSNENHYILTIEINVHSNLMSGKRQECKGLSDAIHTELIKHGFRRITRNPFNEQTVFRVVTRYTAVVSLDNTIYGR